MAYPYPMVYAHEFKIGVVEAVEKARGTPTTVKISQTFGYLLHEHEWTIKKVPWYLQGCVDAIYLTGLNRLRDVAVFKRVPGEITTDDFSKLIVDEIGRVEEMMEDALGSSVVDMEEEQSKRACEKSGSEKPCQSPIMEA